MRALARDSFSRADGTDHSAPWGAALDTDGVWTVLIEANATTAFGQAITLAFRHRADSVDMLIGEDADVAGAVARRGALFDPSPTVWQVDGTEVRAAQATAIPTVPAPELAPEIAAVVEGFEVETVTEHGVITIEYRGLEVGRVMLDHAGAQRLDVGVGAYDQGAFATINPGLSSSDALRSVLDQVTQHRRRGAEPHPINRLVRERWLRAELIEEPERIGLKSLERVATLNARDGLYDVIAAPAIGVDAAGAQVLVVCSVGVDLDLVATAADLCGHHGAERIVLVLPERDQYPVTRELADRLRVPVEIATADEPWA